ncbi:3',5'-cyclic-nucleotide phosphodiesterase [Chloropicon primus]|uniref:3',5'-cyclic-nucleotide phosphodiesterase n=1 Tax=Chloropicon primus TaxID=1764295 RepID=A0A5B8MJ66_9CHLO|nr:3',5'-cyclic-nucleotide phosphodiesterase [Chloropicon primus]UPQ99676.1 3',5'-cyclic-nucleotide phosphodiesterase [Chloropicon primus]|mmetsp:Transcript_6260/g.18610  ORF Transcript_6260/g.18610 Transcript_6260/m.18610 type:complete len:543 (+) Transcript_6260:186-1814(+)|eukprot:QDZ20467.1 3',5'-cyclic-nucleotide phosphodiesterase [Chloropicon primus]
MSSKKKKGGGGGKGSGKEKELMNSSWAYESARNLDKTHLANIGIAPCGTSPEAEAVPFSHKRSLNRDAASFEPLDETEEEKTTKYNNSSRNGSDNFGVGYLDESTFGSRPREADKHGAAHEDSIYKVMSHNFGKAKEQIIRNDSAHSLRSKGLEAAYMSKRDEEEVQRLKSRGSKTGKSNRSSFSAEDAEHSQLLTGQVDWLHLMSDEEHRENMKALTGLEFSVWDYSQRELVGLAWSMYYDADLIEEFQIPAEKFHNFILAIFAKSHDVPYHNYFHYFIVLHTSWLLLKLNPIVMSNLTKTDILGCLTGAIGHDADHPGLTNSFLSATKHWLSIRYNDLSVLENHHCATTYTILSRDECNIFCNLKSEDWKATRNVIVSAILNTDMARHFNLVANFDKMFKNKTMYECCANRNLRNQIVSMIVHCADISNPVKPWFIAKRFADSVAEEFRKQVEQEKSHGVPCTPHMLGLDTKGQAKMELGFIDVFTWPAMVALNSVLPNLEVCFQNMEQNREFWQDIMESNLSSRSSSGGKLSDQNSFGK